MKSKNQKKKIEVVRGYFTIMDFMTVGLKLTGPELLVFALIYSYTYSGGKFNGSRKYISEMTGLSQRSVERGIAKLLQESYIFCAGRKGGGSGCGAEYTIDLDVLIKKQIDAGWYNDTEEEREAVEVWKNELQKSRRYEFYMKRCPENNKK